MNILVTGANGQLGNEMQIVAKGSKDTYFYTDVCGDYDYLDITDLGEVCRYVKDHDINCIVNCAAWTNVEAAEAATNQTLVERLNAIAPKNLAQAMKEVSGLLIHISTDYVFGAEPYNTPCREDQKGTPTGMYGLTKLQGEKAIQSIQCDYVIIRTAWLYSEYGKNFVKTMLNLTANKPSLKVVVDQAGTPTYALDLANAIYAIIEDYKKEKAKPYVNNGIYHYSNEGVCSWYDFAKMIAGVAEHDQCDIQPCRSDEFPSAVKRPAYSVLDKTKIKQTFNLQIPYWTYSLKKCIANLTLNQL